MFERTRCTNTHRVHSNSSEREMIMAAITSVRALRAPLDNSTAYLKFTCLVNCQIQHTKEDDTPSLQLTSYKNVLNRFYITPLRG